MKIALLALPLLFATAPALAMDDTGTDAAAVAYSLDTPIETLMSEDATRAVVLQTMPGLDEHPAYGDFKSMSLKAVQPFSGGEITDEMLKEIAAGLAELD